jgi:hypothetical protein
MQKRGTKVRSNAPPALGSVQASGAPNPKRVAAGKRNRQKSKGLTPAGRAKLREAALRNQPWRFSTGPRTAEGKAKVALNGKRRQLGPISTTEIRADLAQLRGLIRDMRANRNLVEGIVVSIP